MKHVKCEPRKVEILKGDKSAAHEIVYKTPAPDFQLNVFYLKKGESISFSTSGVEIALLTSGHASVKDKTEKIELRTGTPAAIIFAEETVQLSAVEDSTVFRAIVPFHNGK
jgi:mannose-6-phosphate isomerase class I